MNNQTLLELSIRLHQALQARRTDDRPPTEDGFEVAQAMGIALLGLVVAVGFQRLLVTLGADIVTQIRTELGMGGGGG